MSSPSLLVIHCVFDSLQVTVFICSQCKSRSTTGIIHTICSSTHTFSHPLSLFHYNITLFLSSCCSLPFSCHPLFSPSLTLSLSPLCPSTLSLFSPRLLSLSLLSFSHPLSLSSLPFYPLSLLPSPSVPFSSLLLSPSLSLLSALLPSLSSPLAFCPFLFSPSLTLSLSPLCPSTLSLFSPHLLSLSLLSFSHSHPISPLCPSTLSLFSPRLLSLSLLFLGCPFRTVWANNACFHSSSHIAVWYEDIWSHGGKRYVQTPAH